MAGLFEPRSSKSYRESCEKMLSLALETPACEARRRMAPGPEAAESTRAGRCR